MVLYIFYLFKSPAMIMNWEHAGVHYVASVIVWFLPKSRGFCDVLMSCDIDHTCLFCFHVGIILLHYGFDDFLHHFQLQGGWKQKFHMLKGQIIWNISEKFSKRMPGIPVVVRETSYVFFKTKLVLFIILLDRSRLHMFYCSHKIGPIILEWFLHFLTHATHLLVYF